MNHIKIAYTLVGILCTLALNGCVEGSKGVPGSGVSFSNTNSVNEKLGDTPPILTSLTLWTKTGETTTANAAEIIGNNITVKLPADTVTNGVIPVRLTFTGADTISKDGVQIESNTIVRIDPQAATLFTVTKNGVSKDYTLSTIADPYFKFYDTAKTCVKDADGNIWAKTPNSVYFPGGEWSTTLAHVKSSFSACGIPAGEWSLPSSQQGQAMINRVPLTFQFPAQIGPTTIPLAWFNGQTESGVQLFNLPNAAVFWNSEEDKNNPNNALAMQLSAAPKIVSDPKQDYFAVAWPIVSGDGNSAKTITDFAFTPENGVPSKGIIAGNQIFVTMNTWVSPGNLINAQITMSMTGGNTFINGAQLANNSNLSYDPSHPTPITVIAKNGSKNIYTLIVTNTGVLPPSPPEPPSPKPIPAPTPPFPGALGVTVCSSYNSIDTASSFNRIIVATIGQTFYQQTVLPPPGACWTVYLGRTTYQDLAKYPIRWYSFFNVNPIGSSSYSGKLGGNDAVPEFTWKPTNTNDPSGFDLSVSTNPTCYNNYTYKPACPN
ncbi:MAG: hypothetical protein K0R14_287 [Burkholderiales bacterium]|nr:hypothetical protein [Burkholderiales bacterium]